MSKLDFSITGGDELERALMKLPKKLGVSVAKTGVRAMATVIRKEAKRNVAAKAVDTGDLNRSIDVVARQSKKRGEFIASVVTRSGKKYGAKGKNAWYASMIEFGTKNRPATPFMRPALDTKYKEAIKVMADKISARITKLSLGPK